VTELENANKDALTELAAKKERIEELEQ